MLRVFKRLDEYTSNNFIYLFWQQDNKPIEIYIKAVVDQKLDYLYASMILEGRSERAEVHINSSA